MTGSTYTETREYIDPITRESYIRFKYLVYPGGEYIDVPDDGDIELSDMHEYINLLGPREIEVSYEYIKLEAGPYKIGTPRRITERCGPIDGILEADMIRVYKNELGELYEGLDHAFYHATSWEGKIKYGTALEDLGRLVLGINE